MDQPEQLYRVDIISTKGLATKYVEGPRFTLGRSNEADLCCADPKVSRCHLSVWETEAGLMIQDEESRNGTWLNDEKVPPNEPVEYISGQPIYLGHEKVQIHIAVAEAIDDTQELIEEAQQKLHRITVQLEDVQTEYSHNKNQVHELKCILLKTLNRTKKLKSRETKAEESFEKLRFLSQGLEAQVDKSQTLNLKLAGENEQLEKGKLKLIKDCRTINNQLLDYGKRLRGLKSDETELNEQLRVLSDSNKTLIGEKQQLEALIENLKTEGLEARVTADTLKRELNAFARIKENKTLEWAHEQARLEHEAKSLVKQAKKRMANEREAILSDANKTASEIVEKAESEAKGLLESYQKDWESEKYKERELFATEIAERKSQMEKDFESWRAKEESQITDLVQNRAGQLTHQVESTVISTLSKWPDIKLSSEQQLQIRENMRNQLEQIFQGREAQAAPKASFRQHIKALLWRPRNAVACIALLGLTGAGNFIMNSAEPGVDRKPSAADLYVAKSKRDREDNRFRPEKTSKYKTSYTDNILYFKDFLKIETSEVSGKKWLLELSDFFLKELNLSEENAIKFVLLERDLIKNLNALAKGLTQSRKEKGIAGLRKVESGFIEDLTEVTGGKENFRKVQKLKKIFWLTRNDSKY